MKYLIEYHCNTFDKTMTDEQLRETIKKISAVMPILTERERNVLKSRFGIDDGKTKTLEETGKEFGVTRERIRQIEAKSFDKIREFYSE